MASKKNRWQGGLQIELRTEFLLKSVGVLRCPMTWKSPVLELRCVEAEKSKVVKQVCCNGNWTDLKVNTLHCGACGKVCKKRDSCVKGTCLRACLATSECPEFSFCRVGFCRSCPSSKYCDQLFSMIPNEQVLGIRIQGFLFSGGGACSPLWAVLKNIARAGHEPKIVWRTYEVHRHFPCEPEKLQSFASRSFPDRTESIISDVSLSGTIYSYRRRYEGFAITINSLGSHQVRTLLNIKGGHRAIPHGIWASQKGFAQFFFGYDLTKSVVLNNKVMKGLDLSRKGFLSILLRVNVDGSYKVGYVFGAEGVAVDPVFVIGDQKGNIFVAAHYNKSFTIEGTKLEYYGKKDLLFAKISPQNKLLWVKALNSRSHVHLAALQIDKSGNFYLAGHFQQKLQLDSHKFSSKGGSDVFVLKLDAKGKLLWGQCFGGIDNEQANDFLLTRKGSLMLLGEFSTQMKLGAYKFSSKGKQDLFLGKFDPNGKLLWWEQAGGSEDDLGASLSLDPQGNLWVTGSFLGGNSRFGHLTGKFSVARKEHAFLWRLQVE